VIGAAVTDCIWVVVVVTMTGAAVTWLVMYEVTVEPAKVEEAATTGIVKLVYEVTVGGVKIVVIAGSVVVK